MTANAPAADANLVASPRELFSDKETAKAPLNASPAPTESTALTRNGGM